MLRCNMTRSHKSSIPILRDISILFSIEAETNSIPTNCDEESYLTIIPSVLAIPVIFKCAIIIGVKMILHCFDL